MAINFNVKVNTPSGGVLQAPLTVNVIDKLFIVIDYHPRGQDGKDAKRDIIKFVTPKTIVNDFKFTPDVEEEIKKDPSGMAEMEAMRKSKEVEGGEDTLTPMGWRGIVAKDIADAYTKASSFLGTSKVKLIVLRTHGGVDKKTKEIQMVIDNNWVELSPEEKAKTTVTTPVISSIHLEMYLKNKKDKNLTFFPDRISNIEALMNLTKLVRNGGDFVVGSCHSSMYTTFISPLQLLTGSRVNMYGVHFLSEFPAEYETIITFKVTTKEMPNIKGSTKRNVDVNLDPVIKSGYDGIAYITKDSVFNDTTILSPTDLSGVKVNNRAYKYPVGWGKKDDPDKLSDLKLNARGLSF